MISNHQVGVDGDGATCVAYFQATHVLPTPHGAPNWVLGGRYNVRLRRLTGHWRISALTMTAVWSTGNQKIMDLAAARAAAGDR